MTKKPSRKTAPRPAALITGGAIRFGREMALTLARAGYDIALHYHSSEKEAEATCRAIKKLGARCRIYQADLAQAKFYEPLMAQVMKDFPRLSLLINSASVFEKAGLMETSEALFDQHMAINFKAPFFLTQYFARHAEHGQVINILDTYIGKSTSSYFAYLISKKALYEFTRMAARELAPCIAVNAVAPGTTGQSKHTDKSYLKHKRESLPQKRLTTFEGIAAAVMLLVGSNLTGQCIFADSGEQLI